MTASEDITSGEGVNEGSAASTGEGDQTNEGSGVSGSLGAASRDAQPRDEYDPSPPVEMGLPQSETPADALSPGQQLEEGEG